MQFMSLLHKRDIFIKKAYLVVSRAAPSLLSTELLTEGFVKKEKEKGFT